MIQKTEIGKLFQSLAAKNFIPKYCKTNSWQHKLRGKNSRGNPLNYSEEESERIKTALKKYISEL